MKILWAGPYFSEYAFTVKRTPNIASTVWSHGFVKGLLANGVGVEVVTLCPEQAWPKGRVFWQNSDERLFDHDVPVTAVPYLNVAGIREWWQSSSFSHIVGRMLSNGGFDVFSCYNVLHPYHVAAMKVAAKMGVKVCPIVLDGGYDPTTDDFMKMSQDARYADGVVFLSKYASKRFPANGRSVLQMEGGVDAWRGTIPVRKETDSKFVVTYAGAFTPHRGQGLVEMVKNCRRKDVRFIVCGKWNVDAARQAFGDDARVELRGMVATDELKRIYAETDVFINSREASWGHNLANFPSKVSAYLGYGRPIVSNWIESFPDEYRELLCVSEDDTGASMARKLEEVLSWTDEQRKCCYDRLHAAYSESKSWEKQARRFLDFATSLTPNHKRLTYEIQN